VARLHAARELSTAWAEYNQGFVQHPALIAQLELIGAHLAGSTDADILAKLEVGQEIHRCEWRDLMDGGKVPDRKRIGCGAGFSCRGLRRRDLTLAHVTRRKLRGAVALERQGRPEANRDRPRPPAAEDGVVVDIRFDRPPPFASFRGAAPK